MTENVCNLLYLKDMMGGKNMLIRGMMDDFLIQLPEEMCSLNAAVRKTDYPHIKSFAHTMKSSVSIMGISILIPVLLEMEDLGTRGVHIEKIEQLNLQLNFVCKLALDEIETEKHNYE